MKIKITEIEANAQELKASNSVADGLLNILRSCVNPYYVEDDMDEENPEES